MTKGTWIRLDGSTTDLDAMLELFPSRVLRNDSGVPHLEMGPPISEGYDKVLAAAEENLNQMNGARVRYPDLGAVQVGTITVVGADGSITQVVTGQASIAQQGNRLSASGTVGLGSQGMQGNPPMSFGDRLLAAAEKNPHFKRAIELYANIPDWAAAYKIYEVVKEAHEKIPAKWASEKLVKDFTATANSYPALGKDARHAKTNNAIPVPRMTLEKARQLIHALLSGWSEELMKDHKA
jgi:hypothetical protein